MLRSVAVVPFLMRNALRNSRTLQTNYSARYINLQIELRSGRVGRMNVANQQELDKLFERSGSLGLVAEDTAEEEGGNENEAPEVPIVTKIDQIGDGVVYQLAYAAEEGEAFEDYDDMEDVDEMERDNERREEREQEKTPRFQTHKATKQK